MTNPVSIRLFQPADQTAIRRICIQTGLLGEPLDPVFSDVELAADILVGCYYALEPVSFFVAEESGRPIGYLSGCLQTVPFMRKCRIRVGLRLLRAFLTRGHLFRPSSWRFAHFSALYGLTSERMRQSVFGTHPSHLHINLDAAARGRGAGTALIETFLAHAALHRSSGVHLTTASPDAKRFFMKAGFRVFAETPFHDYQNKNRLLSLLVREISLSYHLPE